MAHVDLEEVQFPKDIHIRQIADLNKDEEDERDEKEKRGEDCEALPVPGGGLEVTPRYCVHGRAGEGGACRRDLGDCRRVRARRGRVPDSVIDRTGHLDV